MTRWQHNGKATSCRSHSSAATRLRILAPEFNGEPGLQPQGGKGTEIRRHKKELWVLFVLGNQGVKLFDEELVAKPLGEVWCQWWPSVLVRRRRGAGTGNGTIDLSWVATAGSMWGMVGLGVPPPCARRSRYGMNADNVARGNGTKLRLPWG